MNIDCFCKKKRDKRFREQAENTNPVATGIDCQTILEANEMLT